jgi:transposase-like protein
VVDLHCMDCGSELETINYTFSSTKYRCDKCNSHWFKTTHTIVEWSKKKIEPPKELEFSPIHWDED